MKKIILTLFILSLSFLTWGKTIVLTEGFMGPEAVCYDEKSRTIYVSNINGDSTAKDNNGYIAKLNWKGKPLDLDFIKGGQNGVTLNAPKGLVITGGKIIVTDIDHIRGFDLKSGAPLFGIPVEGALFLNDTAVGPEGEVYFTDMNTSKIYKLSKEHSEVTLFADSTTADIIGPNGLIYDEIDNRLLVVGREKKLIWHFTLDGELVGAIEMPAARLDGIVADGKGNFYITSWETSSVYRLDSSGEITVFAEGLTSPADLGIDRKKRRVLIPQLREHKMVIIDYR